MTSGAEQPEIRPPSRSSIVRLTAQASLANMRQERSEAIDRLAETVRGADSGWAVVTRLIAGDPAARRFALELTPRLPLPVADTLIDPLTEALADARLPIALRQAVAAHLLCSLPASGKKTRLILDHITRDLKPRRALDRLRDLANRVIGSDALEERITRVEESVPMRCPRCRVKLMRPEMAAHLWEEHRLLLDGQKVREPWKWVESRLREYVKTGDAEALRKASELAEQVEPDTGLVRVQRMLLAVGHDDPETLNQLRDEAERRGADLCPECYAVVPRPPIHEVPPMTVTGGRIACRGRAVEVSDRGLIPHLTVSAPGVPTTHVPEPGRYLTHHGRILMLSGPCVTAALVVASMMPTGLGVAPWLVTLVLLWLAALLYLHCLWRERAGPSKSERAVRLAWTEVVPGLLQAKYTIQDGDFIAALAHLSLERGDPSAREPSIRAALTKLTERAEEVGDVPVSQIVALERLMIADAAIQERDPILLLADAAGNALAGHLPLETAERVISDWESRSWWTRRNQSRLRVLLCVRAFEAGLGVWEVHELGRFAPRLADAMRADDLDGIAALRHLWEEQVDRGWDEFGPATPVFDLARYPVLGGQYLRAHPDLLLFQPTDTPDESGYSGPILVCEEGIIYRDKLIREDDFPLKLRPRGLLSGGGYELSAGDMKLTFRKKPTELAERLSGWMRYLFRRFRPTVDRVLKHRDPARLDALLDAHRVTCPECQRVFLRG